MYNFKTAQNIYYLIKSFADLRAREINFHWNMALVPILAHITPISFNTIQLILSSIFKTLVPVNCNGDF